MLVGKTFLAVILLSTSPLLFSAPLSHDNIKLIYADGGNDDIVLNGYAVEGDYSISNSVFLNGFLGSVSVKSGLPSGYSVDGTIYGLGIAGVSSFSKTIELYGGFQITTAKTEFDTPFGSEDDTETNKDIFVGINFSNDMANEFSFNIERNVDGDEKETLFETSARYFMESDISIGIEYEWNTSNVDYSAFELSLRYDLK